MIASHWKKTNDGRLLCNLCPHRCRIVEGAKGLCGARRHVSGALIAESYGRATSIALDPIEKKPLYRFHPGTKILSIGSYGCNLRCAFCQNHEISTGEAPWEPMSPEDVAALSARYAGRGNLGVAYTYNEPLIGFEYVRDCAELVRKQGQLNVLVTNGYVEPEPLHALLPLIDAMNIDLKGFTDARYRELGGSLEPVMRTIEMAAGCAHVEVTALIVPGENDSPEEMDELSAWLAGVDAEIPLHVSRFFPRHRVADRSPTPVDAVYALARIARAHLTHVYTGNC